MKNKLAGVSLTAIGLALAANGAFAAPDIEALPTAETVMQLACGKQIRMLQQNVAIVEMLKDREQDEPDSVREERIVILQNNLRQAAKDVVAMLDQMEKTAEAVKKSGADQIAKKYTDEKAKLKDDMPGGLALGVTIELFKSYDRAISQVMSNALSEAGFDVAGIMRNSFEARNKQTDTRLRINWELPISDGGFSLNYEVTNFDEKGASRPVERGAVVTLDNFKLLGGRFVVTVLYEDGTALGVNEGTYERAGIEPGDSAAVKETKLAERLISVAMQGFYGSHDEKLRKEREQLARVQSFCANPVLK